MRLERRAAPESRPLIAGRAVAGAPLSMSFEFFPPNSAEVEERLWRTVERLEPLAPTFVSVTYGAGGSTRERTHRVVARIQRETKLAVAAHLTCVAASRAEVDGVARAYCALGVTRLVALRGDMPGGGPFAPHPEGYANAAELVRGLRCIADFDISVAAYPEGHPDSSSPEADLDNLKRKIDAGAARAITQYFFEVDTFLRFRERVRAAGVDVPLVPGILPVTNFAQVVKFSARCGASIPAWLGELFEGLDDDPETRAMVAASVSAEQCRRLRAEGVDGFHFYTLNRAELCSAICRMLGVRPEAGLAAGAGQ